MEAISPLPPPTGEVEGVVDNGVVGNGVAGNGVVDNGVVDDGVVVVDEEEARGVEADGEATGDATSTFSVAGTGQRVDLFGLNSYLKPVTGDR